MLDGFATVRAVREEGRIVDFEWSYVNPAGATTYGRQPEELVGARLCAVLPGLRESGMFERYCAVVENGERLSMVELSYADEGARGTFDLRAWKLDDGFAVTWRDVTDREQASAALRASEERFRASVEHLHEALSVFTAVRHGDGSIVDFRWSYANPAASAITGYSSEELQGRLLLDVLPDHGPSGMLDVYKRVVETGEPYIEPSLWYEDVWGDGERRRRAFDVRATKLHDGFVVVTREVTSERERAAELACQRTELERSYTEMLAANERAHAEAEAERRRLEAQLHQSQRLESLGQLAGGVAHDFNNLLAVILNYSAFVGEEIGAIAGEGRDARWTSVLADVEEIRRAGERAAVLTRQLLTFGRREVVRPRVLDLNDVVVDVEQLLRRTLGAHVELVTALPPDLRRIVADPGQIEQVLVNLAVNARDAMSGGGTLSIDTADVVVDMSMAQVRPGLHPGPYVRLRVSDNGPGMTTEVRARAFEPFFTTKPKGKGTGLGLTTVYGIVAQAGGHAEIYSEEGMGATFAAYFPATAAMAPQPSGDAPVPHRLGGRETVLVVEDEQAIRTVTQRILAGNGYTVLTAASGEEAIAFAAGYEGVIDLLLTDVVMPQMLGKEVADRLVRARPSLRVLYMSGYARPVLASQGTLDPGIQLLEKPFSEAVLLAEVRELLDSGR
jgi:PAS domain S-box-containing protein